MANNYLLFSEEIPNLTLEEKAWLTRQLDKDLLDQDMEHVAGLDYKGLPSGYEDHVRSVIAASDLSELVLLPEYVLNDGCLGFSWAFGDADGSGCYLWLYSEEYGDVSLVVDLVKAFLCKFRPNDKWCISYAMTCSKPRIGEFGGGYAVVSANEPTKWS